MSNFKVGDKVVCINPIHNLKLNSDYQVKGILDFGCGNILLDVGVANGSGSNAVRCRCGKDHPVGDVYYSHRFRKLDHDFAEKILAEIREKVQSEYQLN